MRDLLLYLQKLYVSEITYENILKLEDPREILTMSEEDIEYRVTTHRKSIEKLIQTRDDSRYWDKMRHENSKLTQVMTILDEEYPEPLRYIEDPPQVLYTLGKRLELTNREVAIVGARKSTAYGQYGADHFAKEICNIGGIIVSGMAQGIDSRAHRMALECDSYTIGVLGCGIDQIFPKSNRSLFQKMYNHGTIVSEFAPGVGAMSHFFPMRNRIISGLSRGVVVIEAKDRSGSLITARLGAEQGKEVFALPGNINSIYSVGTNKLIRDGAIPLLEIQDIIDHIPSLENNPKDKKVDLALTEDEEKIIESIGMGGVSIDKLSQVLGWQVSKISPIITMLEIKGLVVDTDGVLQLL